jgi:hypothetical protein
VINDPTVSKLDRVKEKGDALIASEAPLNTEPGAVAYRMLAFDVAKTVTEPLAVASGCQTQPALKYSW